MPIAEAKLETTNCPVCDGSGGIEVGTRVREAVGLVTVSCERCGTLYQPRHLDQHALQTTYELEFSQNPTLLSLPIPEGSISTDDPQFEAIRTRWHESQATHAATLGRIQRGDRVLELGCGTGTTLRLQAQKLGVRPLGVAHAPWQADAAREAGLDVQFRPVGDHDFAFEEVDVVQVFHLLQRVPNPLALLRRAWECLAVGGQIVIEVPNALRPIGLLEETFLRATDIVTFSEATLAALMRRAGFTIEKTVSSLSLFVVGRKDSTQRPVVPFNTNLLADPGQDAAWVSSRLQTYAALEHLRAKILNEGPNMDLLHQLVHLLMRPAFGWHIVDVVLALVDNFMGHRAIGLACLVTTAASEGPYEPELTERFAHLAQVIRRDGMSATGLTQAPIAETPAKTLQRFTRDDLGRPRSPAQPATFSALIEDLRSRLATPVELAQFPLPLTLTGKAPPVARA